MKRKHLLALGIVVLISIGLITQALLFLHPSSGDGKSQLNIRFYSIDNISKGTRVTYAGKPIGEVRKITLLPETFERKTVTQKPIFPYELTISIDSAITVYKCDEITLKTAGLMGERSIAISPKPADTRDDLTPATQKEILYASQPATINEIIQEFSSVAVKTTYAMESFSKFLNQNKMAFHSTLGSIDKASQEFNQLLSTINTTHSSQRISSCLNKMDTLLTNINQHGLLFHTNTNWKREMLRMQHSPTKEEIFQKGLTTISNSLILMNESKKKNTTKIEKEFAKKIEHIQSEIKQLFDTFDTQCKDDA